MSISSGAGGCAFEIEDLREAFDVAPLRFDRDEDDVEDPFETTVTEGDVEEVLDSVGVGDDVLAVDGLLDAGGVGGRMKEVGSWTGD